MLVAALIAASFCAHSSPADAPDITSQDGIETTTDHAVDVGLGGPATSFHLGDLNGDGYDDVLLRHRTGGGWRYYAMDGHSGTLERSRGLTDDLDHTFAGVGDLDGDGTDDILIRHLDTGAWMYYTTHGGGTLVRETGLPTGHGRRFAGIGDLDYDGRDDVLLRDSRTGAWTYYDVHGTTATEPRGLTSNLAWRFAGLGDFNSDGHEDVLLRHVNNGQWLYYAMDGQRGRLVRNVGLTANSKWMLAGVGDFNRDGRSDVLLRHVVSGHWIYYAMDGRRGRLVRNFGATHNRDWVLTGVGDVTGDGYRDLVLRSTASGQWLYYAMRGKRSTLMRNFGLTTDRDWVPPAIARATAVHDTDGGRFIADQLDDFDIGLPVSCPHEVDLCVRDHRCEDGDAIRLTVNGDEVFSGELFSTQRCLAIPVREGTNTLELYAINGTGFKGLCEHRDANSGRIAVTGGNEHSQTWMYRGDTGSTANINVTVGGSGPCRPTPGGADDGNDTPSGASALPIGVAANGSLDGPDDVDYWRVEVPSRGRVVVETTGSTNTRGRLEDASGTQLAADDDGGPGRNLRIELDLDPGTYYVRVTSSAGGTGPYGLRVSHAPERTSGGGYNPGQTFSDCASCPEMVVIPSGSFRMGCLNDSGCDSDQFPVHRVTISRPFALGRYEVTFAQWDACVAAGGCGDHKPSDEGWGRGDRPVINVDWVDARSYASWLWSQTGHGYRLPSESEWEYATRAGTATRYSWGDEIGVNRANCDGCGSRWDRSRTAPVGSFRANPWGLYDVHGNVWEWTQDCWNFSYDGAPTDGTAWDTGHCSGRVWRGGSWRESPSGLRSGFRNWDGNGSRIRSLGFRVARTLD